MPSRHWTVGPGPNTGGSEPTGLAEPLGEPPDGGLSDGEPAGPSGVGLGTGEPLTVTLPAGMPSVGVGLGAGRPGAGTSTGTVRVWVSVTVGAATVTVTVARRAAGAARSIGRVELAGSEWLAPPMTTPATTPAAAASVTGRRHHPGVGSAPNMPS